MRVTDNGGQDHTARPPDSRLGVSMAKTVIDLERCKGCGLCVEFCPQKHLRVSEKLTSYGIHPVAPAEGTECTGCKLCVLMCPDAAISLYKEESKEAVSS